MVGRVAVQQAMRKELHLSFSLISRIMCIDGRTCFAHVFSLPKSKVKDWDRRSASDQARACKVARLLVRMESAHRVNRRPEPWTPEIIDWALKEA